VGLQNSKELSVDVIFFILFYMQGSRTEHTAGDAPMAADHEVGAFCL
jgi:hypothetical protein